MVRILGAGLSGLTTAINLAKAGYEVEVFELRKNCGERFDGDLQGIENWTSENDVLKELKAMNLKMKFFYKPFKNIVISDGVSIFEVKFKRPLFYLVKRGSMSETIDQALKKQVEDNDVKIYFNSKIGEAHVDIIASGPKNPHAIAKGIVFETDIEDIAMALIEDTFAYNGYSYLLVSDGYGTMCSVVFGKLYLADECFKKTKETFIKLTKLKIKNQKNISGYGYFKYPPTLRKNNKLYVGEAAGIQDALFGFGMRYAITSGFFASKSIIDKTSYEDLIKRNLFNKLKASIVNRFLWETLGNKKYKILEEKAIKYKDLTDIFFKLYNFSFKRQRLLFPLAFLSLNLKYKWFSGVAGI